MKTIGTLAWPDLHNQRDVNYIGKFDQKNITLMTSGLNSSIELLKGKRPVQILIIYLRYLIGAAFVFSAISKIEGHRFTSVNGEHYPIDTAWHYFETMYRSGMYWYCLGWGQLIAGLILMTQRYATLGAVMMLPISVNMFLITLTYHFTGTVYVTGMILVANFLLLLWDARKLSFAFQPEDNIQRPVIHQYDPFQHSKHWAWLGLLLFVTTVIYVAVFDRNPLLWLLVCILEGAIGLVLYKRIRKLAILA